MASPSQLATLIDLAQRETDDCAKRLGAALKALDDCRQKLDMLSGYRDDYAQRFEASMSNGITPMAYRNFQAFMVKLDSAIQGQQQVVEHAQARSENEKMRWQLAERKRMSYTTLNNRAQEQALKLENKRDQKAMDEHAARQAYYKR
ncbi:MULTISPECIES: flagellar export protein FliJ [Janthinobacterium]|jgi:flagellar FliJ protein|uniref:Flagellar FliJ protein n=3 Tax=Janthinobacterium TaxID=29580 RepID=A0A1S1UE61_9BURK|nr:MULTISPECIES: flagellar export protein FliJ [Janthinobacterium]MBH1985540.1 flagellar export protein FliJ [Burkholderiales bacterium]ATD62740.1 flagellar export protein FliJ [Janthinobacterium svalbardensis]MBH2070937.1 flagellar export protein FliJ [Burkholderiales bacterium]MDI3293494.1 flagellar export protein FliJ [Janthinobacterium tructae]OHV98690.1 flagellar biosynthesis protein FliJ [Janthinobacterium lividum]